LGAAAAPAALPDAAGTPAALPSASPTPPATPGDTRAVGGLQDASSLPLTRNVVSNASFTASNANDGSDALKGVAGVASANSEGAENSSITIRGVKLDLFASYRLNGGLPIAGVINTPAEDKQRVEALKGANALMFGVSSPGGIVNVVTKRPTLDFAEVSVSGNSFGQIGAALDVSRLVGNQDHALGVRVNLSSTEVENGIRDGGGHANFASVAADWQVVRRVKLEFDYEGYRRDVVEQANITPLSPINGFVPVPRVPDPTRLASGPWDVYTPRTQNYDLRALVELSHDWHVLLEAGRSKSKRSRIQSRIINYNIYSGEGTESTVYLHDQAYTNTFLRTELKGRFDTGFVGHDLTLGVSSSERYYNGAGTFTAPNEPQNIYAPVELPAPPPLTLAQLAKQTFAPQDPRDIGIYGYDTVTVFPKLKLLLGIRQVTDEQNDANTLGVHVKSTSKVYTPAAGLLYDVLPKTTVYGSYMKGLVEGTQAPQQAVNSFQILGATLASQEEVGVRSTFFPGFSGSVAYFHLNVANSNLNQTTNVFQYDGVTNYSGVETTLHEAFNRWWSLDASGLVLSAIEQPVIDLTLKGLTPENTAKVSGHLELTHRYAWLTGFTTSVGASYLGRRYVNSNDQGAVPGFALFNAGAGYVCHIWKRRTAFQITVQNALDKSYWNSATSTAYGTGMVRSLRFNVRFDF
jgi:iron complex outermembrane receptor protein